LQSVPLNVAVQVMTLVYQPAEINTFVQVAGLLVVEINDPQVAPQTTFVLEGVNASQPLSLNLPKVAVYPTELVLPKFCGELGGPPDMLTDPGVTCAWSRPVSETISPAIMANNGFVSFMG
jgi:hypothetical protein